MMEVYLDTSALVLLLFGAKTDTTRSSDVQRLLDAIDDSRLEAVISLYGLQELCVFCYDNFPIEQSAQVSRLALHSVLGHELLLVPLLNRAERILLNRRFPMSDASDQVHASTAYHHSCDAIVTYDRHYQEIADRLPCLTAKEVLDRIGEKA